MEVDIVGEGRESKEEGEEERWRGIRWVRVLRVCFARWSAGGEVGGWEEDICDSVCEEGLDQ